MKGSGNLPKGATYLGGLTPGGREQHWTSCHFYSFSLRSVPSVCHNRCLNWGRKSCVTSMENQKTEFGATTTTGKWRVRNARKERATEEGSPKLLCKLYPYLWLILELYICGTYSNSRAKAKRTILWFQMMPTKKESLQFKLGQVVYFKK